MSSVANDTDVKALLHYSFRSKYVYLKQFSAKLTHYIKKKKKILSHLGSARNNLFLEIMSQPWGQRTFRIFRFGQWLKFEHWKVGRVLWDTKIPEPCPNVLWLSPKMETPQHLCLHLCLYNNIVIMFRQSLLCFHLCSFFLTLSLSITEKSIDLSLCPPFGYFYTHL